MSKLSHWCHGMEKYRRERDAMASIKDAQIAVNAQLQRDLLAAREDARDKGDLLAAAILDYNAAREDAERLAKALRPTLKHMECACADPADEDCRFCVAHAALAAHEAMGGER